MNITELLRFAVEESASDIHVSVGNPPIVRIHGDMKKLDHPVLADDEVHRMIYDIMNDNQRKDFEEMHELDFSFELGDVGRFRVNAFLQRRGKGAVFRTIPTEILSMEQLGVASHHEKTVRVRKRAGPGDRAHWEWQVDDPGVDGGSHQRQRRGAHPDR